MALMPKYLWKMLTGKAFMPSKIDAAKWMFNTMSGKRLEECLELLCPDSGTVCREIAFWKHSFRPLPCPTLVIGAVYDEFTPNQRAVAEKFGAEYVEVPCCHALICDNNYMSVVAVIDAWISKKFRSVEE
jgi:pimeloyl-ACP methyl ester carboxylesterase